MSTKNTKYFDLVLDHWKKLATIRIWEIAALMRGIEPRAMTDVTDRNGDPLDLSLQERMLTSAIAAGVLPATSSTTPIDGLTEVSTASLLPWLRNHGFTTLAAGLSSSTRGPTGATRWTDEFTAEVKAYRDAYGTKATAEKFGISSARIRAKLPGSKGVPKGFSAFNQGKTRP